MVFIIGFWKSNNRGVKGVGGVGVAPVAVIAGDGLVGFFVVFSKIRVNPVSDSTGAVIVSGSAYPRSTTMVMHSVSSSDVISSSKKVAMLM
ncbi:hypothetical protein L2E82_20830 [Cichorium intybus]|uniref:Uncharacterized protein n=1 Tax=Cichorium intybus TaxID=13427 RepID=A0ACB9DUR7_CICIN|nr:hypothetical protein L2E82_20830 [Cichorium intybus]